MPGPQRYSHDHRDNNEDPLIALAEQLGACMRKGPPLDWWAWVPRRAMWVPLPPTYTRGVLAKYAKLVGSASKGAVCD